MHLPRDAVAGSDRLRAAPLAALAAGRDRARGRVVRSALLVKGEQVGLGAVAATRSIGDGDLETGHRHGRNHLPAVTRAAVREAQTIDAVQVAVTARVERRA